MNLRRYLVLLVAVLLIAVSWWGVVSARAGLVVQSLSSNGVKMLYIAPQNSEKIPGVLVAHGFAGSKQLMLGYGQVLAHAGYAVMLWDFNGHGASEERNKQSQSLQQDMNTAAAALVSQPEVDPARLALLGHSMGSGVVMSAGIKEPGRFAATVAISPTGAFVTSSLPRNLQLQAGSWEGGFVANAQRLFLAAGGENQNLESGRGRSLVIVPNAEHITILFRDASHQAARRWLDATFGVSVQSNYVDNRMIWYALHLIGWLLVLGTVIPKTIPKATVHPIKSWGGLVLAPLVAAGGLMLLSRVIELESLGGLRVGGAVGIWFLVAGLVWLSILFRLPRPTARSVVLGLALFVLLWIAFGLMAQVVWLQW